MYLPGPQDLSDTGLALVSLLCTQQALLLVGLFFI